MTANEKLMEVRLPDIGDFKDVPVIELFVKAGDSVAADDPLLTLETEKAAMEVPSPAAGTVREVLVKVGDKLSQGALLLRLEGGGQETGIRDQGSVGAASPSPPASSAPTEAASPSSGSAHQADMDCDILVLGAGPGGYAAAFRAADLGMRTVMVERYATLGGVCLNVGCIPSKALLHAAKVIEDAADMSAHGIRFAAPKIDLDQLRAWKAGVVGKLTQGLTAMAKARKVQVVQGVGRFLDAHHLAVESAEERKIIKFEKAIIAAGSRAVKLPFMPEDPRIVDSTGALELRYIPKHLLVLGGGIIGLEMATVYGALGAKISVVEMLDGLMPGTDRDLVKVWQKYNAKHFDKIMLKTRVTAVEARKDGLRVSFEGEQAPDTAQTYDMLLVAAGRTPNGKLIAAEQAGIAVNERGFIEVDSQMRSNVPHIHAIGDIVGQPMLAHKATHEGHVAAEAAAGLKSHFDATVIPSVAYTSPEIAWAGLTEEQAKARGMTVEKSVFPWAASGRAIANGRDEGFTKLLFDPATHRLLGGAIVGAGAGDLISEIALAIEMGCDATDIGKTIHPHPTLSESIGLAAELFEGVCTDLPPPRKK